MLVEDEATTVMVEILERALEAARRGDLRGLAVVMETPVGVRSLWASEMPTILGAGTYALAHELMTRSFVELPVDEDEPERLVEMGRN